MQIKEKKQSLNLQTSSDIPVCPLQLFLEALQPALVSL